jgi:hypothetical protein
MAAPAGIGGDYPEPTPVEPEEAPLDAGHMAKVEALRAFFAAGKKGDMEAAAEHFQTAYDLCKEAKAPEPIEDVAIK